MNAEARTVNNAAAGGGIGTTEYGPYGEVEKTLSAANRQTALNEGGNTALNAARLSTKSAYEGEGTRLAWTIGPEHVVKIVKGNEKVPSGTETLAYNRVLYYYDEGAPANGETYDLVTKTVDEAETPTGEHFDIRTSTTSYSGQNNLGWRLRTPTSTVSDPEGLKITHTTVYDETTGNALETRGPASTGPGNVHDAISVYYTPEANATYPACGGHIEWTGLPCEVLPGKQPETPGLPPLPAKTVAYNMWDEPEAVTEAFGSTTRTRKTTFDEAGRALTSEVVSTADVPVPTVSDHYDETTGALVKESETVEGKEKTITSAFNKLGQLTSYTDAGGNATTFEYEGEGSYKGEKEINGDGRLRHINDGKGTQTYTYDETSGLLTKLEDSAAGTFTASYDAFGRMTSETYPNNMTAYYTRNSVGATTSIEYKKNAHCATSCPEVWFNDTIVPSVHGEMLKQASSLSEEPKYAYDEAGRLTEVQEIPSGKGCVTRLYAYDIESNRTSLTSREPNSEGKCTTTGGTVESHTYDQANRLMDTGVGYDTFGNTTKVPASDSGGAGISSSFYVDSQLASQEQNEVNTSYTYDPSGRLLVSKSKGKTSATSALPHYGGAGGAVTWMCEEAESSKECEEKKATKWTRNIPGMDGALTATQTSGGTITLLLHDLQGNVVAEAALSETETKLLKTYNSTEFGVPQPGTPPPKYSWLGASGVASESSTGTVVKDGITYVPQTGRSLQTQSLTVPSPQNAATEYTDTLEPWVAEQDAAAASQQVANAEQARRALEEANKPPGVLPSGNPGWWCGGEYGECECNEETEGCGPDPAHGANPWGCGAWVSWGHGLHLNEYLAVHGHWACSIEPAHIEIEIALLEVVGNKYVSVDRAKKSFGYPEGRTGEYAKGWTCNANRWYQAWVWARTWDGWTKKTTWYATAEDGHWDECPEGVEDPTEGPDQIAYK
jgi:YD repeat-containing protein